MADELHALRTDEGLEYSARFGLLCFGHDVLQSRPRVGQGSERKSITLLLEALKCFNIFTTAAASSQTWCSLSESIVEALELYRLAPARNVAPCKQGRESRMTSVPKVLYTAALKGCQLGTQWLQALMLFQDSDGPSYASFGEEMQDSPGCAPDIAAFNPCPASHLEACRLAKASAPWWQ